MNRVILSYLSCIAYLLFASVAYAEDYADPAREIMDVEVQSSINENWDDDNIRDKLRIFNEDRLNTIYSKRFVSAYRENQKFPAQGEYPDSTDPFDYEPIIDGSDQCGKLDIKSFERKSLSDNEKSVVVKFRKFTCPEADEPTVNTVEFKIIRENGKYVIDDILRLDRNIEDRSLVEEMKQEIKSRS